MFTAVLEASRAHLNDERSVTNRNGYTHRSGRRPCEGSQRIFTNIRPLQPFGTARISKTLDVIGEGPEGLSSFGYLATATMIRPIPVWSLNCDRHVARGVPGATGSRPSVASRVIIGNPWRTTDNDMTALVGSAEGAAACRPGTRSEAGSAQALMIAADTAAGSRRRRPHRRPCTFYGQ